MRLHPLFNCLLLVNCVDLVSGHHHHEAIDLPYINVFGHSRARAKLEVLKGRLAETPNFKNLNQFGKRTLGTPNVNKHKACGPQPDGKISYCELGDCCSIGGHCGTGYSYCSSPACQTRYSNGCDASRMPLGEPTLSIPRPKLGNVTYDGLTGISECAIPGTVALTFDDGPYNFTNHVLDVLAAYNAKATFFVTGNNIGKGSIDIEEYGWPDLLRRMHREGHQIAAHTWTHQNLSSLNDTELENQFHYVEMAIRNVLGVIPTYYRPPYSDLNNATATIAEKLGYHTILYNLNVDDYLHDSPELIQEAKDDIHTQMDLLGMSANNSKILTINHDIHYQTAFNLTDYLLDFLKYQGFENSITVGDCMGDPKENWYRNATGAPPASQLRKASQASSTASAVSMTFAALIFTIAML